jgi:hypothetical protein
MALLGSLRPAHAQTRQKTDFLQGFSSWLIATQNRKDLVEGERDLRLELIHRLKFEVQQKYSDQNTKDFLITAVKNVLLTDRMPENRSLSRLIPYLENLLEALKTMLEPREDALQFAQTYTEYSSVTEPLAVSEFGRSRDYSNGKLVLVADPLEAIDAAEIAEKILNPYPPEKPLLFDQNLILDFELSDNSLENKPKKL